MNDLGFFVVGATITIGMVIAIRKLGDAKGGADWMLAWVSIILSGLDRMLIPAESIFAFLTPAWDTLFAGFLISGTLRYVERQHWLRAAWSAIAAYLALRLAPSPFIDQESSGTIFATIVITAASVLCTWLIYNRGKATGHSVTQVLSIFFLLPAVAQGNYAAINLTESDLSAAYFMWLVAGAALCITQVSFLVDAARREANISRETLALMAEAAPVGLCLTSPTGIIRAVNGVAATLLKRGSYLGDSIFGVLGLDQQHLPSADNALTLPLAADGKSLRIQSHQLNVEGQHVADVWFVEDISANELLRSMIPRTQYLESLRTMTGNIAHIFNNQLAVVLGHAELIQAGKPSEIERHVANLVDATMRCSDVTRDFLLLTGPSVENPTTVAVESVLSQIGIAQPVTCNISVDIQDRVMADDNHFRRVFQEIFDNAIDAGATQIHVSAEEREPGFLAISVRDNGRGLADIPTERVFEPFFSTKGIGSGIGLSVVRGIVSSHGGNVWLHGGSDGAEIVTTWPRQSGAEVG